METILPPNVKHVVKFNLHGHNVTMNILAYRNLCKNEIESCKQDFAAAMKNKKLECDIIVTVPTLFY